MWFQWLKEKNWTKMFVKNVEPSDWKKKMFYKKNQTNEGKNIW